MPARKLLINVENLSFLILPSLEVYLLGSQPSKATVALCPLMSVGHTDCQLHHTQSGSRVMLAPLRIPPDLPAHTREFLTQLDTAISNAAAIASIDPDSYRMSAREYRRVGLELNARDADRVADRIELDPRLIVAGIMYNQLPEGITKWFLRTYITLIEQQAKAARTKAELPWRGLPAF
jgi:hypothetical protein